jgi:hypothetical protein
MNSNSKALGYRIVDLMHQVELVDDLIQKHLAVDDAVSSFMVKQYYYRREEFIDQLNEIFQKYNLSVAHIHPFIPDPKPYKIHEEESLAMSMVAESKAEIQGK